MSTIIPYFDPLLGKLRNSDVALISLATLVVTDPLIVNNLIVNSNASINTLKTNAITNTSTISTNGLGLNFAQWNSNTSLGPLEGLMNWSSLYGTIQLGLAGGTVDVPLGLTTNLPKRVRNSTGSTMPKGTAVYLNGVSGNTPLVERALATGDRTSAFTIGMTAEDIANNATGWVTSFGLIRGVNTSSFTSGDTLYLSGATAGYYTNVPTKAPIHYVRVGTVTKASADGEIIVNVINGYELDEIHNVIIASLASGQILQSGASSYWYNRSLASAVADFISIPSIPSLGSLAVMNQLSFTSLTNQPSLSSLAFQSTVDYTSNQLTNKPSLGSLAIMNQLSYGSILNTPSLGSLAVLNDLSFTSLLNQPSLSSLAFQSTVDYVTQVTSKPSLGSLAPLNSVTQEYLPSTASFTNLYITDISTGGLAVTSTASIRAARITNLGVSTVSVTSAINTPNLFGLNFLGVASLITTENLGATNAVISTATTGTIYADTYLNLPAVSFTSLTNLPSLGSLAVMNQLSFTSLTNQPSLSSLAFQATIDYTSAQLTNKPSLGSLAVLNGPLPANSPASTNRFVTAYNSSTGAFTIARPTWANIDKTLSAIGDISDVFITSPSYGQVLSYEPSFLGWENKTPADTQNLLDNSNFINNSTNGYGALSDGWSETNTSATQGGFPVLDFSSIYDAGTLSGLWYLKEASGSAIDENGVYTLTESSAVTSNTQFSLMGKMRTFSGANRFSGTVAAGNVAGSQTFFAFIRPSSVTGVQHICGYNDGTRNAILYLNGNKAAFNMTGLTPTAVAADVPIETGKWYLIIGSYDSGAGELRIFVNGVYKSQAVTGTHVVTTNSVFQIGSTNSAAPFTGSMNCVGHVNNRGWDIEKMKTMFAITLWSGVKIERTDTISEISCYQLLGREQMHRFSVRTITFTAEVWQENSSNAKLTIYSIGTGNIDSFTATTTGAWETVTVTTTLPASLSELYFNVRSSSGTVGAIWYRNLRINYGGVPIGAKIYSPNDWIDFPRLLMLDIPKMFDGKPYQYEENRWYSWTPTLTPAGSSNSFTTEWRFNGKTCTTKGQITSTHASATWTHTLPIKTAIPEIIYTRHLKIQNNAGTVALGNWVQTTGNSTTASMFSSIANAGFSTTSGVKVAQIEMIEWEID
jgi:hypothetical protein